MVEASTSEPLRASKGEEPTFEDTLIFYNYVFDIGGRLNPIRTARRILNTNYGIALSNYATDTVELSDLFKKSLKVRSTIVDLATLSQTLEREGLRASVRWALRHPRTSIGILSTIIRTRGDSKESTESVDHKATEKTTGDGTSKLKAAVEDLDLRVARAQSLVGLHRFSDQRLFSEIYLGDVPFVRLDLQSVIATFGGNDHGIDVGLLIHRTGIAILTFYVTLAGKRTVDELIDLKVLQNIKLTKVTVPDALMGSSAIVSGVARTRAIKKYLQNQTQQGKQSSWELESDDTYQPTLRDVLEWYRLTLISTVINKEPSNQRPFLEETEKSGLECISNIFHSTY